MAGLRRPWLGWVLLAGVCLSACWPAGAARGSQSVAPSAGPLHEVSYYPRDFAWDRFWRDWPQARTEMASDLDRAHGLGVNTIRVFLDPWVMGYPQPSAAALSDFDQALGLMQAHGLKAHVTLFSCWGQYEDLAGSRAWLQAVVRPHQADARIALWELANEVDLSRPVVRQWLEQLFPYLKQQAAATPATASVNKVEWLSTVKDLTAADPPDVYDLHWYPTDPAFTTAFPNVLDQARQQIGGARLLLGEFGYSTFGSSEQSQAALYRDVLYDSAQKGVTDLGVWTLNDFSPGTQGCGGSPIAAGDDYFGLYRADGTPKPAAAVLQQAFQGAAPAPEPRGLPNQSFELLDPRSHQLADWLPWDSTWSGHPWLGQDCQVAHSGACSAKISAPGGLLVGMYEGPLLPVQASARYGLAGYARGEQLAGWARLAIAWSDSKAQWLDANSTTSALSTSTASDWRLLAVANVIPPPNAAYLQVYAQVYSGEPAQVWLDDLSLTTEPGP